MELNNLIFPYPEPKYDKNMNDLVYINTINKKIPLIFLKTTWSNKIIIYFHGNSEDLKNSKKFAKELNVYLNVNFILVEYPSYGIYKNCEISESVIYSDSIIIYNYTVNKLRFNKENIMIMGLSIGSGPATYLASIKKSMGLILIAPFLSVKKVVNDKFGFLSFFIKEKFKNYYNIKSVFCPLLIVHGKKDTIIKCSHGLKLYEYSVSRNKMFINPEEMTHNNFKIKDHIAQSILDFFKEKL